MATKRPVRGVIVFSFVVGACLSQRAGGFVPSSCGSRSSMPPHCSWSTTGRATALAMSGDESAPLSRAQLMKAVPALVGVVSLGSITAAKSASAALPTAEDYSFGSGSKTQRSPPRTSATTKGGSTDPCPDCSLSERRKRAASPEAAAVPSNPPQTKTVAIQDELSIPFSKSSVNPDNPVEVVRAMSGELDRIETLVKKERWGDALMRVRSYPLTALKSKTLGMKSVGDVARALGVGNTKASDVLEASMEAGLTLREVEDIVFSNTRTLEFFNSADLKQMEELAKNRQPTDLTEPLQLISETKRLVDGVSGLMGAGATAP